MEKRQKVCDVLLALNRPCLRDLAFHQGQAHIADMASSPNLTLPKGKPNVLGRSAITGRFVMAPVSTRKSTVSDKQIATAVKGVLANRK